MYDNHGNEIKYPQDGYLHLTEITSGIYKFDTAQDRNLANRLHFPRGQYDNSLPRVGYNKVTADELDILLVALSNIGYSLETKGLENVDK